MIFNDQTLLQAFGGRNRYHSPKCFSTIVVHKLNRFEPKDYALLPKNERLVAHLYSIWEDKYTESLSFRIIGNDIEVLHD